MIEFRKVGDILLLSYSSSNGTGWLKSKIKENRRYALQRTFSFSKDDIYHHEEDEEFNFVVAKFDGDYYKFDKEILQIERDVYIDKNIEIDPKFFIANNNISVFKKIDELLMDDLQEIRIGMSEKDNLPYDIFGKLIKNFPTTTELKHYAHMRVETVIKDYLELDKDYEERYNRYMDKKPSIRGMDVYDYFDEYEVDKYKKILAKLKYMLNDEEKYTEKQWQKEILEALKDDLNISRALAAIDEFVAKANEHLDAAPKDKAFKRAALGTIAWIDTLLGIGGRDAYEWFHLGMTKEQIVQIEALIEARNEAKRARNFDKADAIRDELGDMGIQLMDTPNGTVWERAQ